VARRDGRGGRWDLPEGLEDVAGPFRFWVRGGDHTIPDVEVLVRLQPTLSRLDVWYRYPRLHGARSHAGREAPVEPLPDQRPPRDAGAMRGWCDLPLDLAYFVFEHREAGRAETTRGDPPLPRGRGMEPAGAATPGPHPAPRGPGSPRPPGRPPWTPRPLVPPPERAASMVGVLVPMEADRRSTSAPLSEGFRGRNGKTVLVRSDPRPPPTVKIVEPDRASEEVTAGGDGPHEFLSGTPYGIRRMSLETPSSRGSRGRPGEEPFPRESPRRPSRGARRGRTPPFTLDLPRPPGSDRDELEYFAQAE